MKRRNGEIPKLRRPVKRSKITDGIYGSTLVYLKFFMLWALVLLADFLLEFRFEFLWPFWLLLRSVYDSYKYQGLAFSVFFVSIALTSDMICYFFIPVQWLFFAASTYVWVQYVWHAEKGICFPTVVLWFLFAYMEAAVRLKDLRHMPFHLDLCRPFAAHCIGYPVVTLGFGFKSYVSYRIRQNLMQYKESQTGAEMLLRTVTVLQDKTAHLENSLSAETRIKLDLFSALGEAKRHLEIRDSHIRNQEREIEELKAKLAQVLAVMPGASDFLTSGQHSSIGPSKLRQMVPLGNSSESHSPTSSAANSNLDPNASVYTPKPSRLVSEA
ncbi:unnamed protein product [Nesidiocoris tenuis]|uniref:Macoilin n=1 Tax=Nesidiocoris tenuis TaxID=355587 RepID=A0A6H5HL52_9HEMI|nr:unnamed protein product [Nesidiocoris tenuis]